MGNTFYNRTTILSKVFIITFFVSINLFGQKNVRIGFLDLDLVLNNNNDYITANQNLNQKLIFGEQKLKIDKKKYWVRKNHLKLKAHYLPTN